MMGEAEGLYTIVVIGNKRGLHARAAAKFVKLAETFLAEVAVVKDEMHVSACSIMGLMMLAAGCGAQIQISASGPEAAEALTALSELVKRKFDEE